MLPRSVTSEVFASGNNVSSKTQELLDLAVGPRKFYGLQEVLSLKIFLLKILSTFLPASNFYTHKKRRVRKTQSAATKQIESQRLFYEMYRHVTQYASVI